MFSTGIGYQQDRCYVKTGQWQSPGKQSHFNWAVKKSRTEESKWPVLHHDVQTTKLTGTHTCTWENTDTKVCFSLWLKQLFHQLKSDSFQELLCAYWVLLLLVLVSSLPQGLYVPGHNSTPHACSWLSLFICEIPPNPALLLLKSSKKFCQKRLMQWNGRTFALLSTRYTPALLPRPSLSYSGPPPA